MSLKDLNRYYGDKTLEAPLDSASAPKNFTSTVDDILGEEDDEALLVKLLEERMNHQKRILDLENVVANLKGEIQKSSNEQTKDRNAVLYCLNCKEVISSGKPPPDTKNDMKVKNESSSFQIKKLEEESASNNDINRDANDNEIRENSKKMHELIEEIKELQSWNQQLIDTVEKLRLKVLKQETDFTAHQVVASNHLEQLATQVTELTTENNSLKKRIASEVLQQRMSTRMIVAEQRIHNSVQVRRSGLRRLEQMEAQMMELNDDLFFRQRCDGLIFPRRNVTLVLFFVNGITFPLSDNLEDFVINVYQQVLLATCQQYKGFRVLSKAAMDVFVFQDAQVALEFTKNCEEQINKLEWPHRVKTSPFFRKIEYDEEAEEVCDPFEDDDEGNASSTGTGQLSSTSVSGGLLLTRGGRKTAKGTRKTLYLGPRMHCCLYTCTPEVEVNQSTGETFLYGREVQSAVDALVRCGALGEIIVNQQWVDEMLRKKRFSDFGTEAERKDKSSDERRNREGGDSDKNDHNTALAASLRNVLSQNEWEVFSVPSNWGTIKAVLLPASLKERRQVPSKYLHPSVKFLHLRLPPLKYVVEYFSKALKGVPVDSSKLYHYTPNVNSNSVTLTSSQLKSNNASLSGRRRVAKFVELTEEEKQKQQALVGEHASKLLDYFKMKQEKEWITSAYTNVEKICAQMEQQMMASEDRFLTSKQRPLNPSETAFVCTFVTGTDAMWRKFVLSSLSPQEYDNIRIGIRAFINHVAKLYYGFYMNGNQEDIFTYVFREVEQALNFVSDIYIYVNRTGTKYSKLKKEIFLFSAGISSGPMASIYRNTDEQGMLKCTGPVIRLSATLCDLAREGEILAMEDIISEFHRKNENLLDQQFNIVKQGGHFLKAGDSVAVVHSILPRPFAYRRTKMMSDNLMDRKEKQLKQFVKFGGESLDSAARSATSILFSKQTSYDRKVLEKMLNSQLQKMESIEAATLAAEDTFMDMKSNYNLINSRKSSLVNSSPTNESQNNKKNGRGEEPILVFTSATPKIMFPELKNPWMFTTQKADFYNKKDDNEDDEEEDVEQEELKSSSRGRKREKEAKKAENENKQILHFLYCEIAGNSSLHGELVQYIKEVKDVRLKFRLKKKALAAAEKAERAEKEKAEKEKRESEEAAANHEEGENATEKENIPPFSEEPQEPSSSDEDDGIDEDEFILANKIVACVYEHYHYVVQSIFHKFGGYVCANNGETAYVVSFASAHSALEAGVALQQELNSVLWPNCLRPLEVSLFVKEIFKQCVTPLSKSHSKHKTSLTLNFVKPSLQANEEVELSKILFNGPRPSVVIHSSEEYDWYAFSEKQLSSMESDSKRLKTLGKYDFKSYKRFPYTPLHVSGQVFEELYFIAKRTHGGELRLTPPFTAMVSSSFSCKELYDLLEKDQLIAGSADTEGNVVSHPVFVGQDQASSLTLKSKKSNRRTSDSFGELPQPPSASPAADKTQSRSSSFRAVSASEQNMNSLKNSLSKELSTVSRPLSASGSSMRAVQYAATTAKSADDLCFELFQKCIIAVPAGLKTRLDLMLDPSQRVGLKQNAANKKGGGSSRENDDYRVVEDGKKRVSDVLDGVVTTVSNPVQQKTKKTGFMATRASQLLRILPVAESAKRKLGCSWCSTAEAAFRALPRAVPHDFLEEEKEWKSAQPPDFNAPTPVSFADGDRRAPGDNKPVNDNETDGNVKTDAYSEAKKSKNSNTKLNLSLVSSVVKSLLQLIPEVEVEQVLDHVAERGPEEENRELYNSPSPRGDSQHQFIFALSELLHTVYSALEFVSDKRRKTEEMLTKGEEEDSHDNFTSFVTSVNLGKSSNNNTAGASSSALASAGRSTTRILRAPDVSLKSIATNANVSAKNMTFGMNAKKGGKAPESGGRKRRLLFENDDLYKEALRMCFANSRLSFAHLASFLGEKDVFAKTESRQSSLQIGGSRVNSTSAESMNSPSSPFRKGSVILPEELSHKGQRLSDTTGGIGKGAYSKSAGRSFSLNSVHGDRRNTSSLSSSFAFSGTKQNKDGNAKRKSINSSSSALPSVSSHRRTSSKRGSKGTDASPKKKEPEINQSEKATTPQKTAGDHPLIERTAEKENSDVAGADDIEKENEP